MYDYQKLDKKNFNGSAAWVAEIKIVGAGKIQVCQMTGGKEVISVLKEVANAPKSSTNLVSITRVQRAGSEVRYLAESNKIVSFVNGHKQ